MAEVVPKYVCLDYNLVDSFFPLLFNTELIKKTLRQK